MISSEVASTNGILSLVKVAVSGEMAAAFDKPGQYVMCKPVDASADTKAGFYAITSAPLAASGEEVDAENEKANEFEFLIKDTPAYISIGAKISMSAPQGKGFPITEKLMSLANDFPTQDVLLFAAGSGLAPIRSVIESRVLQKQTRSVSLFVGVKEISHLAYKEVSLLG